MLSDVYPIFFLNLSFHQHRSLFCVVQSYHSFTCFVVVSYRWTTDVSISFHMSSKHFRYVVPCGSTARNIRLLRMSCSCQVLLLRLSSSKNDVLLLQYHHQSYRSSSLPTVEQWIMFVPYPRSGSFPIHCSLQLNCRERSCLRKNDGCHVVSVFPCLWTSFVLLSLAVQPQWSFAV